jgi:carnitine 3-dehydrogenase
MAQFGPALKWPWTKLMDVPELDDRLLNMIVAQSDAQAGSATIRELEALRDDCLVSVLQALRAQDYASGKTLKQFEQSLIARAPQATVDITQPILALEKIIPADWTDYNGHTNDSRYGQLASEAGDTFLRMVGLDQQYLAETGTFFTVESHVRYLAQSHAGDKVRVYLRVLSFDAKRLHLWTEIKRDDGVVAATAEYLLLHVDATTQTSAPMSDAMLANVRPIGTAHALLPTPVGASRAVGDPPAK